jgi:hypothetical protein
MFRIWLISARLVLFGCGRSNHAQETSSDLSELKAVQATYLNLGKYGWEATDGGCDSLLWASLSAVAHNREFNVEAARQPDGSWLRRPEGNCSSTISRDMLIGLMTYGLHFNRLDLMSDLYEYGRANDWKMGKETKPFENRTIMTPNLINLLARIVKHLGGRDYLVSYIPRTYDTDPGFVSHLTMLQIAMLGKMEGALTDREITALNKIKEHSNHNPLVHALLHKYTDGDQSTATHLLLSTWPKDRLPRYSDWSEQWRVQRSDGDVGFQPEVGNDKEHSGGDLLFVTALILGAA